ncbi:MAG: hypothetical protein FWB88_08135 [Defluviitaleaceae bacterium]|nr:hypothetical protein [Defluviitaleaceae bacterium]MCL2240519.1 hypothetical protein [Defluviitaleaceae bacterium]
MGTVRCNKCKNMFSFDGLPPEACAECLAKREAMLNHVREVVKANPGISPQEVSRQTGVPVPVIIKYIATGLQ